MATQRILIDRAVIPHTAFIEAEKRLGQASAFASSKGEAEGLAIIGESGTGKSTVLRNHALQHPHKETPNGTDVPVLLTSVPSKPSAKNLAAQILSDMGVEDTRRGNEVQLTRTVARLFREAGTTMLMIDEFQHFVDQGTHRVIQHAADWLKDLLNMTKITLVVAGLPYCMTVIDRNPQLARRFSAPIVMPRFDWNMPAERKQFRSILRGFTVTLSEAYDCPDLSEEDMAFRIYLATGGLIGYVVRLLRQVERDCITEGKRKITVPQLHAAHVHAIWSAQANRDLPKPFSPGFQLIAGSAPPKSVLRIGTVQDDPIPTRRRTVSEPRKRTVSELLVR